MDGISEIWGLVQHVWANYKYAVIIAAILFIKLFYQNAPVKVIPGSKVKHIKSVEEWNTLVVTSDKIVVVDFSATWCPPCRQCSPYFDLFSQKYDEDKVTFCKVDVDEMASIARDCGVRQMPTFLIYKDKARVGEILGWSDYNLVNYMKGFGLEEVLPPKKAVSPERKAD